MNRIFLVGYKVKGIKSLDKMVELSFYKKGITKSLNTRQYNVKGIYGMNGSGKSAIIESVDIFRNLLTNENYLNNQIAQRNLSEIINKKTNELYINAEFIVNLSTTILLYNYEITLNKDDKGKFFIYKEKYSYKKSTSRNEMYTLFETNNGEVAYIDKYVDKNQNELFIKKTMNLLAYSSASALLMNKVIDKKIMETNINFLFSSLIVLFFFGEKLYVYKEKSDIHTDYYINNIVKYFPKNVNKDNIEYDLLKSITEMDMNNINVISSKDNLIGKKDYNDFVLNVRQLKNFISIFKEELTDIVIDKKEDGDFYLCHLNMVYEDYSINTEFESTGIKKLIMLFAYIKKMVQGGIVFIDEFDSNLHDVYLCALLEYLMEFGKGQLCFTTHNVGPMDVLRKNKKSIDFLSSDHTIYPWKTNGNYSPSNLYREGMIEGSPFNIESIDFIGIFESELESD